LEREKGQDTEDFTADGAERKVIPSLFLRRMVLLPSIWRFSLLEERVELMPVVPLSGV